MHFFLNGVLKKAIYILFLQHWGTKIKNKHNKGKKKRKKEEREKKRKEKGRSGVTTTWTQEVFVVRRNTLSSIENKEFIAETELYPRTVSPD